MSAVTKMVRGEERISFWRGESVMARRRVRGVVLWSIGWSTCLFYPPDLLTD
jgi:hypothetical protein